jgi:hypothetical protein
MRNARNLYGWIGLFGLAAIVAWACSLDSPTAPEQDPPPPGGGTVVTNYRITITAEPDEIAVAALPDPAAPETCIAGAPAKLTIEVRSLDDNSFPPDGTTILLTTSLGSFEGVEIPVRAVGAVLDRGKAFANLFPCETSGVAQVRATLGTSEGRTTVRIITGPLSALWHFDNPDTDLTIVFVNESTGVPESFEWRFGDGSAASFEVSPTHTYGGHGVYHVKLTITGGGRSNVCETDINTRHRTGACPPLPPNG